MKRKSNIILAAFLAVMLGAGMLCGCEGGVKGTQPQTVQTAEVSDPNSISIPGYDTLYFKSDKTKQNVSFNNPQNNPCLFVISLRLEENSETLWTSEKISPGGTVNKIKISRPLEKGEYPAVLKYDCFTADGTPLNGAEIKLTINVD